MLLAFVAVALVLGAYLLPWFVYDFNSGRQTPPGGPQPEDDTGIERHHLSIYVDHQEGDVAPDGADAVQSRLQLSLWVAAACLALALLGEVPGAARIVGRPVALAALGIGTVAMGVAGYLGWADLPGTLAGHGVNQAYTARLMEPNGYVRSSMESGWYAGLLSVLAFLGAFLAKWQAGAADPSAIEEHLA